MPGFVCAAFQVKPHVSAPGRTRTCDPLLRRSSHAGGRPACAQVTGQAGLPVNDREAPGSLRQSGTQRARCMDQEAGWIALDLQPDSTVLDRPIDRRAAPTAPEAVVRSGLYLRRLPGQTSVGPRLVRRVLSVRFSGGFAGPGESVTDCLSRFYGAVAHLGVQDQHQASIAVVSTALARSAIGALVRAGCHRQHGLPET